MECWFLGIVIVLVERLIFGTPNLTVNEDHDGFSVSQIRSGSGLVVCESYSRNKGERIELWQMRNPPTFLRSRTCENRSWTILKMDERFTVASEFHQRAETFFFISTQTREKMNFEATKILIRKLLNENEKNCFRLCRF